MDLQGLLSYNLYRVSKGKKFPFFPVIRGLVLTVTKQLNLLKSV